MNKKTFIEPSVEIVACESTENILAGSQGNVDQNGGSGGRDARRANPGSITPISSSEAFGD